ncbi:abortive phage infection protein [Oscillatoriales cyanobacterium USR001]|nr:abortive phage infection protein [Oscillatoriales cyanobacterium USR001]
MANFVKIAGYPVLLRVAVFLVSLSLFWLPLAAPIYLLVKDSNLVTILTMGLLFVEFIFLVRWWGFSVYQQSDLLKSYGLIGTRQNGLDIVFGLMIGGLVTFSLFGLEGLFGWLSWQGNDALPRLILEGMATALGVGFAEELVFRGWLLNELERDYNLRVALWVNGMVFALSHFLKPLSEMLRTWPQFPGLLLLGLILVWGKRSRGGGLGLPIGFHAGLIWSYYIINVGNLVSYSGVVPDWITGVNRNPLAGAIGLIFLGGLALGMRKFFGVEKLGMK